jgi:hypothetical protein
VVQPYSLLHLPGGELLLEFHGIQPDLGVWVQAGGIAGDDEIGGELPAQTREHDAQVGQRLGLRSFLP